MAYYIENENGDQLFRDGTLAEARDFVIDLINTTQFSRQELASKNIVNIFDAFGGIQEEQYIFNYEDKDERIMFTVIKHDDPLE